jgi:hypothetical protein
LLAHAGTLADEQAERVAEQVGDSWMPGLTAQVQFMRLPSRSSDLQLYTRPAGPGWLLTLVAQPETTMEAFRSQADSLAKRVAEVGSDEPGAHRTSMATATVTLKEPELHPMAEKGYALAWRSLVPLPESLRIALRRGLERIARENQCELSYLAVDENLVHLVVHCPSTRSSSWVAHLFKREAEAAIQTEFDVNKRLWQRGYFAAESDEPLTEVELDLVLNRRRER